MRWTRTPGQDGTVWGTTGPKAAQADWNLSDVALHVETAHPKGVPCPAWGKNCLRSRKSNHFARACPNRKPNQFGRQVRALEGDPDPSTSHPEEESTATEEVYLYCDIADEYDPSHIMQADLTFITETFWKP